MSDEREIENEIIKYSVYKGNSIAFNQIELQMDIYGYSVTIAVDEEKGNCLRQQQSNHRKKLAQLSNKFLQETILPVNKIFSHCKQFPNFTLIFNFLN